MTAYPYVASPDKISALFKKINGMGIPQKFTNKTLKSIGFTSSNNSRLVNVVKFLGLIDQAGVPTPLWNEYRKNSQATVAKATRAGYSDLFNHYPDADKRDAEALRTYFAATTSLGALAVGQMVSTFKAICQLGDFSMANSGEEAIRPSREKPRREGHAQPSANRAIGSDGLTVNINIQLQLPADATTETYERFFEAMRKHIITPG